VSGSPSLKFFKAMENEHKNQLDSDQIFVTTNYAISTTPRNEWEIVLLCDASRADMREQRRIPRISDLMELQISKDSQLEETEVIAVVMYTGPMASDKHSFRITLSCLLIFSCNFEQFQVYNTILRRWPKERYGELEKGGNIYTTTIYVLMSSVMKIAREVRLPSGLTLFRGLGGDRTFPPFFYTTDAKGRKGVLEWGFMSTTASKEIAIKYSGIVEGKPFPTIFEIAPGSVDRGAIITAFSQYPGARTFLLSKP
jgi:hypothetical protein